jgi:hypothetical protein
MRERANSNKKNRKGKFRALSAHACNRQYSKDPFKIEFTSEDLFIYFLASFDEVI